MIGSSIFFFFSFFNRWGGNIQNGCVGCAGWCATWWRSHPFSVHWKISLRVWQQRISRRWRLWQKRRNGRFCWRFIIHTCETPDQMNSDPSQHLDGCWIRCNLINNLFLAGRRQQQRGSFVKINLISFFPPKVLKWWDRRPGKKKKTNQTNFNKTPVIAVLEIYITAPLSWWWKIRWKENRKNHLWFNISRCKFRHIQSPPSCHRQQHQLTFLLARL